MISEFSFGSSLSFKEENLRARQAVEICSGLQLPLTLPGELLNMGGVAETVSATIEHFAVLGLLWVVEATRGGGSRATAVLAADPLTSAVWALLVLENSSTGPHKHNEGGSYGECVITLAGELDDVLDDGTAVRLGRGAVMFHAPSTSHDAKATRFWAGLYHQPHGCTPLM
jgi:hypothetical protein